MKGYLASNFFDLAGFDFTDIWLVKELYGQINVIHMNLDLQVS